MQVRSQSHLILRYLTVIAVLAYGLWACSHSNGQEAVEPSSQELHRAEALFESSCISCHSESGEGGLDLTGLSRDLGDEGTFARWVRIFDRLSEGSMPPADEPRPEAELLQQGIQSIEQELLRVNRQHQQSNGRTVLRRLTRNEFENCVNDLFGIEAELAPYIPEENAAGFDVLAASQGMSPQHIRGLRDAAARAIDLAIRTDPPPKFNEVRHFDYRQNPDIRKHIDTKDEGKVIIGESEHGITLFVAAPWLTKVPGFAAAGHERYRLRAQVRAVKTDLPMIFSFHWGDYQRGTSVMIEAFDVRGPEPQVVEAEVLLEPGQYLFADVADVPAPPDEKGIWSVGADEYKGAGIGLDWLELTGPLGESWPPPETTKLLGDIPMKNLNHSHWDSVRQRHYQYEIASGDDDNNKLRELAARVMQRAYSRDVSEEEVQSCAAIGEECLRNGGSMDRAVRNVCESILLSPEFLFETAPVGKLDDIALARRLARFLWRGLPDDELLQVARQNRLSDPQVLAQQTDRMLADPRSKRMLRDFVNQWLRLSEIEATSPDMQLYPEFDPLLQRAMVAETQMFVEHLVQENLSSDMLIASDFTFVNRRLADHYGIDDIAGQSMRKITLDPKLGRGGVLAQAAIHKVTANGTTTSPVRRGSFVLTHLLGTPPAPPPPAVGSIEPDTRGATTIRELLDKHRQSESCVVCHRAIDPPGFAMEEFDVIGGKRSRYRSREQGDAVETLFRGRHIWEYKWGPAVDPSGTLTGGESFSNFREFQKLLLSQREQVARHLLSQWIAFATGAEIEFADRAQVQLMLANCRKESFGVRTMIHEVVQSAMFRNK